MSDQIAASELDSFVLSDIAHVEMGQSPDSRYVVEDPFQGHAFLQGNAEFGAVFPEPKFGCLRPAKMCKANDVLISVRAPVGAINLADRDYCIGRGLAAIRGRGIKPSLLGEVVARQSSALRRVAQGTTFEAISKNDLLSLTLSLPPRADWPQIAQILDTLDTAIDETKAIIAKLKAIKQGLLHDLLTRGIDTNGGLRPPQAEAPHLYKKSQLGWIPKEWEVVTLRDGALPSRESFIDGDWIEAPFITSDGIRLIQTGNIGVGEFLDKTDSRRFISAASFRMLNCKWVKADDMLICRLADPIGRACIIPDYVGPAITSVDCTIFRVDAQSFSGEFVLAWVNADLSLKRAQDNAAGSTRSRISRSNLGVLPITKPPLHEQQLIAGALQSSTGRIAHEEACVSKLRATKTGLMDDLLTGRVRDTGLLSEPEPRTECA